MPLPALQSFERKIGRQLRLLEVRKTLIERKIERQIRLFEQKRDGIGRKIEQQIKRFELKRGIRLDDEVRFIRSWIERPLSTGAVTPSRSEEHTSELQSLRHLVCRLLLEK